MFVKTDKATLRNLFKEASYAKSPPAVRVSLNTKKEGFCLLVTVSNVKARALVKKAVKVLELESDIEYRVRA